jgi:hypothetical protein
MVSDSKPPYRLPTEHGDCRIVALLVGPLGSPRKAMLNELIEGRLFGRWSKAGKHDRDACKPDMRSKNAIGVRPDVSYLRESLLGQLDGTCLT